MIEQISRLWRLGIIGALAAVGIVPALPAIAQLAPDSSLGAESSSVTPGIVNALPADVINGGAQRGSLLFHSFRDFNVEDSGRVYFANPAGVGTIFTRVTGTTPSTILGTLGVNGSASLFLLNPNGILFSPNARLDIRGSFVASSADRVIFDNGYAFSASTPQAPPLLTISAPIGLQYGSNPGAVRSQGAILQVPNGQTVALVGGPVNIEGGQVLARGGRVELTGVASGEVGLTQQGQKVRVNVPDGVARADVAIGNNAIVNVRAGGGGSIGITAQNLTITGAGTRVRAGIETGLGTVGAQAGDFVINTTGATNINASVVSNVVNTGGTGNAGDIKVTAGSLTLINGAGLNASTFGSGDAGSVKLSVRDAATFDGTTPDGFVSGAGSRVEPGANGKGGNVELSAGSLSVTNGATLSVSSLGQGEAGNLDVTVRQLRLDNQGSIEAQTVSGQGGNITLQVPELLLLRRGSFISSTAGTAQAGGDGGNITLNGNLIVAVPQERK